MLILGHRGCAMCSPTSRDMTHENGRHGSLGRVNRQNSSLAQDTTQGTNENTETLRPYKGTTSQYSKVWSIRNRDLVVARNSHAPHSPPRRRFRILDWSRRRRIPRARATGVSSHSLASSVAHEPPRLAFTHSESTSLSTKALTRG